MPAIHLDRLVQQINLVFEPEKPGPIFRDNFISLLEIHANLAYRPGDDIQRKSMTPRLHLAPVVMQQLSQKFTSLAKTKPELALEYADYIWQEEFYETKYFAALILGLLSGDYRDQVIEHLVAWGSKTTDKEIHQILFQNGSKKIRESNVNHWLEIIQTWVDSSEPNKALTSIYALQTLINDPNFINLPKVFKIILPLFSQSNRKIIAALTFLIDDLAKINPVETSHLLSNLLLSSTSSSIKQITRKCMPSFSINEQKKLKFVLSSLPEEKN